MYLNLPLVADLLAVMQARQATIDQNLLRANQKRVEVDYQVGDRILVRIDNPNKLGPKFRGPYPIVRVHINGTVTIQTSPQVQERMNVRRVKPFREVG